MNRRAHESHLHLPSLPTLIVALVLALQYLGKIS